MARKGRGRSQVGERQVGSRQVGRARDKRQVAKGRKGKQHAPCVARRELLAQHLPGATMVQPVAHSDSGLANLPAPCSVGLPAHHNITWLRHQTQQKSAKRVPGGNA